MLVIKGERGIRCISGGLKGGLSDKLKVIVMERKVDGRV